MHTGDPVIALKRLAELLDGCGAGWVVGGSTGLALRGAKLDQAPRDLDIYADREAVPVIHARLAAYAIDVPSDNETERYRSVLSHYRLDDTIVELVGDFRVVARGSTYRTEVGQSLYPYGDPVEAAGTTVKLVPLGHELIFNLLRDRMDRARLAGQLIAADASRQLPILQALIDRNQLTDDVARLAMRLAQGQEPDGLSRSEEERV
ncbi:nucleotidyltransferase domain-containing protein [Cohnella yongneupensis]|uniref:Nucleotidyltransferase domain-containing protein n=1 Tax=Cohnella yongneupensis TaxID=425006 RepID=A0ABW0R3C8_9BACL